MARYLTKMKLSTEQWAALVKNPHDRREAVRPMHEAAGGKLVDYFFGPGCVYTISEFPDDVTTWAISMMGLASGAVTFEWVEPVMTAEEAVEAMKKAGSLAAAYRPPSQ